MSEPRKSAFAATKPMSPAVEIIKFYAQHCNDCSGAAIACSCGLSQLRHKAYAEIAAAEQREEKLRELLKLAKEIRDYSEDGLPSFIKLELDEVIKKSEAAIAEGRR